MTPRHTAKAVLFDLERGLRAGTIVLQKLKPLSEGQQLVVHPSRGLLIWRWTPLSWRLILCLIMLVLIALTFLNLKPANLHLEAQTHDLKIAIERVWGKVEGVIERAQRFEVADPTLHGSPYWAMWLAVFVGLVAAALTLLGQSHLFDGTAARETEFVQIITKGRRFTINKPVITIGAAVESGNDIIINDQLVSRFHCAIQRQNAKYYLVDFGSVNGTFLDGRRLSPGKLVPLKQGSRIDLAHTSAFQFRVLRSRTSPLHRARSNPRSRHRDG